MYFKKNYINLSQTGGFKKYLEPYEYPTVDLDTTSSKSPSSQLSDKVMFDNNEQANLINLTEGIDSNMPQLGGSLYDDIISPVDNISYNIMSDKGKEILHNYLSKYMDN